MHMYTHVINIGELPDFYTQLSRVTEISNKMKSYFGKAERRRPNDRPGTVQWSVGLDRKRDQVIVRVRDPKMLVLAALILA